MDSGSTQVIGIFRSEPAADAVDAALAQAGFEERRVIRPQPRVAAGGEGVGESVGESAIAEAPIAAPAISASALDAAAVRAAVADGYLPGALSRAYVGLLEAGAVVVSVKAPFGEGAAAEAIVRDADGCEPAPEAPPPRNPAPFSTGFGIPVLTRTRSRTELIPKWSFSDFLGIRVLSGNRAPLSRALGMATLSGKPAERKSTSFGLPLLAGGAAPLSSSFGLSTLSTPKRAWETSFGMPLLTRSAAPLSSLLGLPVLTRKQ
ncbi:hypothetical protein ACTZWW_03465 [Salinarimonas sp. NSM]|uniref:hypothetical protein n=1 Tax=Salinarimonas sp. NSM TaxID=3458003 RepID=UPI0040357F62